MKLGIATRIRDLNSSLLAMRSERWQYLFTFGVVISLAIFFASSVILNSYQITMLAISSSKEIAEIHQYHHEVKLETIKPETTNVSNWHLFGSPPAAVTTITSGNFNLIGIEYSYIEPSRTK